MKIAVFGLGYVGSVTSVCLAMNGHEVWGVDRHPTKVEWISKGIPPIREPRFAEHLTAVVAAGRLRATADVTNAVRATDMAMICVGTPTSETGETHLGAVEQVLDQISGALAGEPHPYLIVVRSTIPASTMDRVVLPRLQSVLGDRLGVDVLVCFNPEFLREGTAISDFFAPPFTVIGVEGGGGTVDAIVEQIEEAYGLQNVQTVRLNHREAELVKVTSNAFHALKIAFANEVGSLAARLDADPVRVMDAFCLDTTLNASAKYLRPGFAFGGSCLPKDVRGLVHAGKSFGIALPVLESILPSNHEHLDRAVAAVEERGSRIVGLVGLVFKADTDDVRESAAVRLARRLLDGGKEVLIHEPEIAIDRLLGANLAYLEEHLPEYRRCLVNWSTLVEQSQLVVLSRPGVVAEAEMRRLKQPVLPLFSLESY